MNKKIFAAAAAVAVTAGGAAAIIANASSAKAEEDVSYRGYSVSKGNITVGTEESGTLSLDREYVSFPCTAEVTEVYVKTGTSVKEGDALLKVDPDDVAEAKKQYELKLRSAQNALDEAKDSLTSGTLKAEQELESAKLKGTSAQSEYELYLSKQENEKETSAKNLADLKKQLEEYENMTLTYDDDYAKLTAYENKLSALEADHKAMEKQYREYQKTDTANNEALEAIKDEYSAYTEKISDTGEKINSLKQAYEEAKAAYEQAQSEYEDAKEAYNDSVYISTSSSDNSSTTQNSQNSNTSAESKYEAASVALTKAYNTYSAAKTAYSGYYVTLGEQISDKTEDYEDKISAAEEVCKAHRKITDAYKSEMDDFNSDISDYREEYEDYKSDFTDIYGNNDADSISDSIEKLKSDISSAQLNIESSAVSESSDSLNAKQEAQSAQSAAELAELTYERTISSLESDVETKQDEYDSLVEEYAEFCENAGDDGVIYAPSDGIVSSVSVSEGDSIMQNATIVILMDTSSVYLSTSVSEEDITALTVGQECTVSLTAYDNKNFSDEIDTISAEPARSSGSVSYTVTVKLDTRNSLNVLEGMSGDVTFLQHQVTDVLTVNVNAITFRDGHSYVKVYDDSGNIVEKEVQTGFTDGRSVEITGVSAGDKLLAEITLSGGKE